MAEISTVSENVFRDYLTTPMYQLAEKSPVEVYDLVKCIAFDWTDQLGLLDPTLKSFRRFLQRVDDLSELRWVFLSFSNVLKISDQAKYIFDYSFSELLTDKFLHSTAQCVIEVTYTVGALGYTYFGLSATARDVCTVAASVIGIYSDVQYVCKHVWRYQGCEKESSVYSAEKNAKIRAKASREFTKIIEGSTSLGRNFLTVQTTVIVGTLKNYSMLSLTTVWLVSKVAIAVMHRADNSSKGGSIAATTSGHSCCAH